MAKWKDEKIISLFEEFMYNKFESRETDYYCTEIYSEYFLSMSNMIEEFKYFVKNGKFSE